MITAAPVVRRPINFMPAPGFTDFVSIFLAQELNADEYRTCLRHEQAHVWAGHNRRRPDHCHEEQWKIACEMEVARNIYDAEDIANITAPRSRLNGAYLPSSIDGMPPEMLLAEDIYEWLLAHPQKQQKCGCSTHCDHSDDADDGQEPVPMAAIREKLDADEAASRSEAAAKSAYIAARNRPPSLTECIDAALRYRVVSEPSFRRPARRQSSDHISKGRVSTPRPPLVEIYVDRSGSFTPEKTSYAERTLRSLLARYSSSIRYDVWFFGNGALVADDPGGGGDTPYHLVAEQINRSRPRLAIVITDDDQAGEIERPAVDIICVPIGCKHTSLAIAIGGKDVSAVIA